MPAYDTVFKALADLQLYSARIGRFLSDQGMGHLSCRAVRSFLVLTECLRALTVTPRDHPLYAFFVDGAMTYRSELLGDLSIPAPVMRAKVGEHHAYFGVITEAIDLIDRAVSLFPPRPEPHPSDPPPLNNTHGRRARKGNR